MARNLKEPSEPVGLYFFTFHRASHKHDLREAAHEKGRFSDAIVMPKVDADYELALVSFDGESFAMAGLFSAGRHTSTGRRRGSFEHLAKLPTPLPMKSLLRRARLTTGKIDATQAIAPCSAGTSAHILDSLVTDTPGIDTIFNRLLALRARMLEARSDPAYLTRSEQRDAIGLVFDIANMNRAKILGNASLPQTGTTRSYLESIPRFSERRLLEHDMSIFGDWRSGSPCYTATRTFTDSKTRVTLMCVDSDKIESTEGVDLIYHFDRYDSLVMVQYKRMRGDEYRPDQRCHDQTDRMMRAHAAIQDNAGITRDESDYRLASNPFFLKVCDGAIPIENNEALVEGMYFPLDHWNHVLDHPGCVGPEGGKIVSRQRAPRWLNNTEFVSLAKRGWIGTTALMSRTWVADLVRKHIDDAHSIILARIVNEAPDSEYDQHPGTSRRTARHLG